MAWGMERFDGLVLSREPRNLDLALRFFGHHVDMNKPVVGQGCEQTRRSGGRGHNRRDVVSSGEQRTGSEAPLSEAVSHRLAQRFLCVDSERPREKLYDGKRSSRPAERGLVRVGETQRKVAAIRGQWSKVNN